MEDFLRKFWSFIPEVATYENNLGPATSNFN